MEEVDPKCWAEAALRPSEAPGGKRASVSTARSDLPSMGGSVGGGLAAGADGTCVRASDEPILPSGSLKGGQLSPHRSHSVG